MKKELILQLQKVLENDFAGDKVKLFDQLSKDLNAYSKKNDEQNSKFLNQPKIIELKNVSKIYKLSSETVYALKNASLDIHEGEMVAIVGPSGSGKSTLLQLIGALDKPTEGKLLVNGQDISKLNDKELSSFRNKTIGFVFQSFYLQSYLNVRQNVEIPLIFGGMNKNSRKEISKEVTESVGLLERINHLPKQLSGGQMQRVAIARALVNKPKIILADEPSASLDKETATEIMELFREINQKHKTTVIIVTHNDFVADYCQRQIKLQNGELVGK